MKKKHIILTLILALVVCALVYIAGRPVYTNMLLKHVLPETASSTDIISSIPRLIFAAYDTESKFADTVNVCKTDSVYVLSAYDEDNVTEYVYQKNGLFAGIKNEYSSGEPENSFLASEEKPCVSVDLKDKRPVHVELPIPVRDTYLSLKEKYARGVYTKYCQQDDKNFFVITGSGGYSGESHYFSAIGKYIGKTTFSDTSFNFSLWEPDQQYYTCDFLQYSKGLTDM